MNWQIELLTSPAIRLVIAAILVAVPALAFAVAAAWRHLRRRATVVLRLSSVACRSGARDSGSSVSRSALPTLRS